jgi:acyl carrier protein
MDHSARHARMIEYLKTEILSDPEARIEPNTPLVSSGLVDSFSLVLVVHELERITALKIPASKVAPRDLDTVSQMFATATRVGTPR